jgi:hypothetical protein
MYGKTARLAAKSCLSGLSPALAIPRDVSGIVNETAEQLDFSPEPDFSDPPRSRHIGNLVIDDFEIIVN